MPELKIELLLSSMAYYIVFEMLLLTQVDRAFADDRPSVSYGQIPLPKFDYLVHSSSLRF